MPAVKKCIPPSDTCQEHIHLQNYNFLLRPPISNELKELIERMLDKSPETRITVPEIKVT